MGSLINKAAVKKYILEKTKTNRKGWDCTCVSKAVLDEIDAFIRVKINESVHRHPSIGKTFIQF